jgi:hypothetical protein
MPTVQPFPMRCEVSDLGTDLQISIPPKRSWAVLFFAVWLTFWTYAGIQTGHQLLRHFSLFSSVWMIGWAFGEVWATYAILYAMGGREIILANSETLTRRNTLFGLSWPASYLVREMRDLRFQPETGSGKGRRGSRIAFDYGAKTVSFAQDIEEAEAADLIDRIKRCSSIAQTSSPQQSGIKFWQQR